MKAMLLLSVLALGAVPSRWVACLLPLLWTLERLLPTTLQSIVNLGDVSLGPTDLLLLVLAAKGAVTLYLRREVAVDRPLYIALGVYLAINLIATFAAGLKFGASSFYPSLATLLRFTSEILVILVVAQSLQTFAEAKRVLLFLVGTLVLLALIQFVNGFGASRGIVIGEVQGLERGEIRYFGPIGDSIGMVLLLGYLFALCTGSIVGAALFLGGILLTAGIGAIIATGVATLLFVLIGLRMPIVRMLAHRRLWAMPAVILIGALVLAVFARSSAATLLDRLTTGNYVSSTMQRGANLKLAANMFLENPFLGVGYMGYERALPRYGGDAYFNLQQPDGSTGNANNQILQAFTDSGAIGFLAFAVLVFCLARLFLRSAAHAHDRFVSLYFMSAFLWLLTQVFGNLGAVWLNPASYITRLLWVSAGVAVALARLAPAPAPRPAPRAAFRPQRELLPA